MDSFELNTLAAFDPHVGCSILLDFKTDVVAKEVNNKSGFLAGIMRRYSKIIKKADSLVESSESTPSAAEMDVSKQTVSGVHSLLAGYDDDDVDVVGEEVKGYA